MELQLLYEVYEKFRIIYDKTVTNNLPEKVYEIIREAKIDAMQMFIHEIEWQTLGKEVSKFKENGEVGRGELIKEVEDQLPPP